MPENPARICAVITEGTIDAALDSIEHAKHIADLTEIRLDYLTDFNFADVDSVRALVSASPRPVIVTCRDVAEGGNQKVNDEVRLRLLAWATHFADYVDVEAAFYEQAMKLGADTSRLIVSHHDFSGAPANLDAIYESITALPAAGHKIVVRANDISDAISIFKLLDRARVDGKKLIALAMGEPGLITRVLGPAFGSFLTYGTIGRGKESAPGQPTCDELMNLYRVGRVTRATTITGIIGNPIEHSASPAMHNRAFDELGLDFVYLPFKVEDLDEFFRLFVRRETCEIDWNLAGFSVTIPHKRDVIRLLDDIDQTARSAGAVNTVVINDDRLVGYNTDVQGAMEPLEQITRLADETCAVIGAGGASRAIIHGLVSRRARVHVFARNQKKAAELANVFGVTVSPIEALESSDAQIVINTTPVGMRGHSEGSTPVPKEWLRGRRLAYDLVYNPAETRFLANARAAGCVTISGLDMLVAQAALQFELWTGRKAPVVKMREAAIKKIAELDNAQGKSSKRL